MNFISHRLAVNIIREISYQSIKTRSLGRREMSKRLRSNVRWSFISLIMYIVFIMFIGLFINSPLFFTEEKAIIAKSILFFSLGASIVLSFIMVSNYSWLLQEYDLLKPLMFLPISMKDLQLTVILVSLYSGGLISLILPLISVIIIGICLLNPILFIILIIYVLSTFLLSMSIGFKLANFFSLRKISGRGFKANIARYSSTFLFILIMFIQMMFQSIGAYGSRLASLIKDYSKPLTFITNIFWFIYPFSASAAIDFVERGFIESSLSLILSILYLIIFYKLYNRVFNQYWHRLISPIYLAYGLKASKIIAPKLFLNNPITALTLKDIKTVFREPTAASFIFLPLVLNIYFLINIFSGGVKMPTIFIQFFILFLFHLTLFLAIYSIYYLIRLDMRKAWILFTLPISFKTICLSKTFTIILITSLYLIPISLIIYLFMHTTIPFISLIVSLTSGIGLMIFISRFLLKYLRPGGEIIRLNIFQEIFLVLIDLTIFIPAIIFLSTLVMYPGSIYPYIVYILSSIFISIIFALIGFK